MLNGLRSKSVVSRYPHLSVALSLVLSSAVHASTEVIPAGSVMGKMADGKYRAYAEAEVSVAFSNAAAGFTLDATKAIAKHFRVGDTITAVDGTALGVIATYNSDTGVGTLTGNSANNLAIGERVKIASAECSIEKGDARVLANFLEADLPRLDAVGYVEGYLGIDELITDHAISRFGKKIDDTEFRMSF